MLLPVANYEDAGLEHVCVHGYALTESGCNQAYQLCPPCTVAAMHSQVQQDADKCQHGGCYHCTLKYFILLHFLLDSKSTEFRSPLNCPPCRQ